MKKNWDFMKEHMPGVVRLMLEKRDQGLGAHLDACWKNGVVYGQPGWFFAAEGGVCVGTLCVESAQSLLELHEAALAMAQGGQAVVPPLLRLKPRS